MQRVIRAVLDKYGLTVRGDIVDDLVRDMHIAVIGAVIHDIVSTLPADDDDE